MTFRILLKPHGDHAQADANHLLIFMCIIDANKSAEKIKKNIRFRFDFTKRGASRVLGSCQIVVVGSHADLVSKNAITHRQSLIKNMSQPLLNESFFGLATLDCHKVSSPGLTSPTAPISKAQETILEKVLCGTN